MSQRGKYFRDAQRTASCPQYGAALPPKNPRGGGELCSAAIYSAMVVAIEGARQLPQLSQPPEPNSLCNQHSCYSGASYRPLISADVSIQIDPTLDRRVTFSEVDDEADELADP
jgi:hypothetical protein